MEEVSGHGVIATVDGKKVMGMECQINGHDEY